jgi:hypothetical protein
MDISLNIAQCTIVHHITPQCIKIHHKSSTNEFANSLMKLKSENRHVATPTSLRRVVATVGSSHAWVQERIGKVVSLSGAMM